MKIFFYSLLGFWDANGEIRYGFKIITIYFLVFIGILGEKIWGILSQLLQSYRIMIRQTLIKIGKNCVASQNAFG